MRTLNIGLLALVPIVAAFAGHPASSVATDVCFTKFVTVANRADEMAGSDTADVIRTGTGPTFAYGYAGSDRICGGGGHDSIWAGPGDDLVTAGAGWDVVDGGDGLTVLPSGDDTLYGGPGRDKLTGQDGADRLYGGAGDDTLSGDADPNSYVAQGAGVKGGSSGHVPLRGEAVGADHLRGGPGDDLLRGGPGADSLFGGAGEDILVGGPGRDILIGGPGHDALIGGRGYDLCFVGQGTDSVQSCELVRVHQPRLGLPADYMGTPPRIVPVTHLAAATRQLASRALDGWCRCTTDPPRSYAGHQSATT